MSIICLEGPSAVGKTTTATLLAQQVGGAAIPEAAGLFERPLQESVTWYLERQVERWAMARAHDQASRIAILDGDPFQPLWYNWVYDFEGLQSLEVMARFYREQIEAGHIAFPHRYFLLYAGEATLRRRKAADVGRRRGGFERHFRFIEPQRRYFRAMQEACPDLVEFFLETTCEDTIDPIVRSVLERPPESTASISLALFDDMVPWLQGHPAS
jgi:hypothetical protein